MTLLFKRKGSRSAEHQRNEVRCGLFSGLVGLFPFAEFDFDSETMSRLERDLVQGGVGVRARRYAGFSLVSSAMLSVLAFIPSFFMLGLFSAIGVAFFSFSVVLLVFLHYPKIAKRKRAESIERDLPLFLRSACVQLSFGKPFESVIESGASGYGELSRELSRASAEIKRGYPVQKALAAFSGRVDSLVCQRAALQLAFVYERGFGVEGLRKLADELIERQRFKSRVFAGKQAFFGLLFISASAIVPALFSAYVMIGSSFLSLTFSRADILLAFAVVFPLSDFLILLYLSESKPKVLSGNG